jgi:undecaprenyl-diphosphatase
METPQYGMIEWLESLDQALFLKLNGLHHPWLDQLMYYMSEELFWVPVYLLFLWLIAKTYNWKIMLWSLLGVAVVVTLGDRISVELFKNVFERYRPSRNLEIGPMAHIVNDYRGGLYGFVSSHATNYFGIATFVALLLMQKYGWQTMWILLWAGLIAYTRIYLGVHYPADIAVGGLLGVGIGFVVYKLFVFAILRRQ